MNNNKQNWSDYFKNTIDKSPSALLVEAVDYVTYKNKAIDIGGGALNDARYLLAKGFETTVIDQDKEVGKIAETISSDKLYCHIVSFTDYDFPANKFDLASAMYALPFSGDKDFEKVLMNIKQSLVQDGIFVGNFFGTNDAWSGRPNLVFHTKEQVEDLFSDFEIISFQEKEYDGKTADGEPKHWHVFNVIARKLSL